MVKSHDDFTSTVLCSTVLVKSIYWREVIINDVMLSRYAQEVLDSYPPESVSWSKEFIDHDGTTRDGEYESDLYDLFIGIKDGQTLSRIDHWHWERWYRENPPPSIGYLEDRDRTSYTPEGFSQTWWGERLHILEVSKTRVM